MANTPQTILRRALVVVTGLLILKVTIEVMLGYANYFPPNFESEFLFGRESYFFGAYRWAFYAHIATAPVALLLGMVLLNESFRRRFPNWHRSLGQIHIVNVLCVVTPTGLWMAYYASTGTIGSIGHAILAVLTATCSALGWRMAVKRQFAVHRRWMWRSFLLLASAVAVRLLGGLGTLLEVQSEWFGPLALWASWLIPLIAFELSGLKVWKKNRLGTHPVSPQPSP